MANTADYHAVNCSLWIMLSSCHSALMNTFFLCNFFFFFCGFFFVCVFVCFFTRPLNIPVSKKISRKQLKGILCCSLNTQLQFSVVFSLLTDEEG